MTRLERLVTLPHQRAAIFIAVNLIRRGAAFDMGPGTSGEEWWVELEAADDVAFVKAQLCRYTGRMTRFVGHFYRVDDDGVKRHLTKFDLLAASKKEAEQQVMDQYWDSRLDHNALPHFEYLETT